jgi:autotransporter-associated beta strand protein
MNKIFRVIWNVSLQCWVVVSELTRSYGKRKSESRQAKRTRLASISVLSGLAMLGSGVGGNSNWTDGSGNVNSNYSTNFAVFQGTPDRVTVDNSLGQVGVTGMQFMTNGYRISGDELALNETTSGGGYSVIRVGDGTVAGSNYSATIDSILSGTVRLSKTDLGNLILTGDNTYSGGTNIAGGTLQLGDGTTNGSILGDIVDASVLALNPANGTTMALSGVISGAGSLRMTGAGTALLTGGNTYTGGTTISSGTLQIGDGSTNGSLPGNVVNNAALVLMPKTGSMLSYTGVISGILICFCAGLLVMWNAHNPPKTVFSVCLCASWLAYLKGCGHVHFSIPLCAR